MIRLGAMLTLIAATAACAPQVPPPHPRALVPAAAQTLLRVIAQYDADIATLRRARNGWVSGTLARHLTTDESAAGAELRDAGARITRLPQPRSQAAPAPPPAAIGPQTLARFQRASEQRVARAIDLRAQQLREREADVAFDFERAHAGRRLALDLKLHALHLAPADAAPYRTELNALTQTEERVVAAQRARDRAVLDSYAAGLRAQIVGSVASLTADVQAAAATARSAPPAGALPQALTRDERSAATAAFARARTDIQSRYSQLRATHDASQASLTREITALERERDALRAALARASSSD